MARNNQRGRKNNNPEGHNQYDSGWVNTAKESPMKTAAAAAAAVGAGVFLWSRRNEISGQISRLSDQITDWADDMRSNRSDSSEMAMAGDSMGSSSIGSSRSTGSRASRSTASRSRGSSGTTSSGQTSTTGMNSGTEGIAH
jgi:hypothetical protein